ncbi:MAG TPA: hypothetical protein VFQ61_22420 [Polyangiaceae bacterium]|nr:hypothetical protein [Polyangiaceae bacterium]
MTRVPEEQVSRSAELEQSELVDSPAATNADGSAAVEVAGIPLAVHGNGPIGAGFQQQIHSRLSSTLKGARVERVIVRFEDLNGPKGGIDTACRIQVVLSGEPDLVVEARAEGEAHAFRLAVPRLTAALKHRLEKRGGRVHGKSLRAMPVKDS